MSNHFHKYVIILVVASFLLASCGAKPTVSVPTATQMSPDAIFTAAAQTAEARRQLTATAMVTPTPLEPTATNTPEVTNTPEATATSAVAPTAQSTATSPAVVTGADNAVWVQDITIPDGTDFNPGTAFTKTWRIANKGTSTWTTSYKLVHVSGDALGAKESVAMTIQVAPDATVDVSVDMVAPAANGNYKSYWRMQNASGQLFGDAIYVDIDVVNGTVSTAQPTSTGGATATATQGSGGSVVSGLSISFDDDTVAAACPHEFALTANFTLSQDATVTYKFDAGTDTPGFTFDLPGENTLSLTAGSHTLTFSLNIANSGNGWIKLHITAPVDITSNQANFSLTCEG